MEQPVLDCFFASLTGVRYQIAPCSCRHPLAPFHVFHGHPSYIKIQGFKGRGLIIRNRSVWSTIFLLNVFAALKGTHFCIFIYLASVSVQDIYSTCSFRVWTESYNCAAIQNITMHFPFARASRSPIKWSLSV